MKIPVISNGNHKETANYICCLIFQFPSFLTTATKDECKGSQGVGSISVCKNTKPPIKRSCVSFGGDRGIVQLCVFVCRYMNFMIKQPLFGFLSGYK